MVKSSRRFGELLDRPVEQLVVWRDQVLVAEGGLYAFGRLAFPHVDGHPLIETWHLQVLCRHLEAISRGEVLRLLINVPPGTGKSTWLCVLWPAWDWITHPWRRWMFASFDDGLVLRDARKTRALVEGDWYQARWGSEGGCVIDSSRSSAAKAGEYWTTAGGLRFSTTIGSKGTGWHSHIQVVDDPHKAQDAMATTTLALEDVASWYDEVMSSRRVPGQAFARVVDMQRLAEQDLSAHVLAKGTYHHLCLPMTYRADHPYLDEDDARSEDGELLCPALKSEEAVAEEATELGPTAAAAQHDQLPAPRGGRLLKAGYFVQRWRTLPPEVAQAMQSGRWDTNQRWIIAGDLAFKSRRQSKRKKGPDHVVLQCWCAVGPKRYLIDQVRGQWGYRESKLQLALFALRYQVVTSIVLEDAANAAALEDDLTHEGVTDADLLAALRAAGTNAPPTWSPAILLEPHGGGTLARTQSVEGIWASGAVYLPATAPWVDAPGGFVSEHLQYSGREGASDDQVSCSSLALLHLKFAEPGWARL